MNSFQKLNLQRMRCILHDWDVNVISNIQTDHYYIFKFLNKEDLPENILKITENYNNIDVVKIALLNKFGGLIIDPNVMILKKLHFC